MSSHDTNALLAKRDVDLLESHTSVNARDARINFSRIVNAARIDKDRVIITAHGEPAAGLVPISDIKKLSLIDGLDGLVRKLQIKDGVSRLGMEDVTLPELLNLLRAERAADITTDITEVAGTSRGGGGTLDQDEDNSY